ncbi:hypothetical protein MUK72_03255 [Halococcus dombrowskii]|uniref:Uncharacterized protein n=1 Tax=Halococcus dombrowskii TaxID=179637 RepID=A0AAV3SFA7_HALDO|nr:hypothetical protein [Halococcus dombrowskii]UOO95733.1 hypothetical protein MUK72_03255 [Halococcus dombrowskii]
MVRDEIEKCLKAYWTAILFLIAATGIVIGVIVGYRLPSIIVEYGTLLLVVVTLATVFQNSQLIKNAAEERKLNRNVLIEQRKDAIVQLLIRGIDSLDNSLHRDMTRLKDLSQEGDKVILPPLHDEMSPPKDQMLHDIDSEYEDIIEDIESYKKIRKKYQKKRGKLEMELSADIPLQISDNQQSKLVEAWIRYHGRVENEEMAIRNLLGQSDNVVRGIFGSPDQYGWENGTSKGWIGNNWSSLRRIFLSIQDDPQYTEHFSSLFNLGKILQKKNKQISDKLLEARRNFKDDYNVFESEIRDKKKEIDGRR